LRGRAQVCFRMSGNPEAIQRTDPIVQINCSKNGGFGNLAADPL
jgi:hypothetical protein